jgi:hypothetical protein
MDNTEPEAQTTLSYFAEDGSYGNAVGLMVLDTTKWTALDWEIIDSVSDNERPTVARLIAESYEEGADHTFIRNKLETEYGITFPDYKE